MSDDRAGDGAKNPIRVLQAPEDEGSTIYHAAPSVMNVLTALEKEFGPRVGGKLFFDDGQAQRLTPFAARLFKRGYVSVEPSPAHPDALLITDIQPEIEARLNKVLMESGEVAASDQDLVVSESDLPFDGRLGALPDGERTQRRRTGAAGRPGNHPIDLLENLLYGSTPKDDPEGSHHGEHEISDGVDRS